MQAGAVDSLTVVCLNVGNYLSRGAEYVGKLRRGVRQHLTIPHEFVEVNETPDNYPVGWFKKLTLLTMFDGDVLYLDLDVILTANIDHLVHLARVDRSKIWARDDWSYPATNPQHGREATINSSVMLWHGRKEMLVTERMLRETHGDQGIITQLFWPHSIGLLPAESVQSYKYGVLRGEPLRPIVVFHGQPKCHEIRDSWVIEHWSQSTPSRTSNGSATARPDSLRA